LSYKPNLLFCFLVYNALIAMRTIFFLFQPLGVFFFIFCDFIISALALNTFQSDCFPHNFIYSIISATTPAPTVRPPSRMAKRNSFSMAISFPSSTVTVILSPGITISTPSGSLIEPVTSVVRK